MKSFIVDLLVLDDTLADSLALDDPVTDSLVLADPVADSLVLEKTLDFVVVRLLASDNKSLSSRTTRLITSVAAAG